MNKRYLRLRKIARQGAVKIIPGNPSPQRILAVAGLPRSGTSWVAKLLSLTDDISYYFEPELTIGPSFIDIFTPLDGNQDELYRNISDTIAGKVTNEYTICELGAGEICRRPFNRNILIKWVRLSLSLGWIIKHFPQIKPLQIIRHPVPLFLSWQKKNWDPAIALQRLLDQPDLMAGPLNEFADVLKGAETYWEKAAAFWGAVTIIKMRNHRPGWLFVEHEWLCLDPESRFRRLVKAMGLHWNYKMEEFLSPNRKIESGPGYGKRRDPREEVHKWEKIIKHQELEEVKRVVGCFNLPFYRNMDPESLCTESFLINVQSPNFS